MMKSKGASIILAATVTCFAAEKGSLIAVNQNDANLSVIDLASGREVAKIGEEGRMKAREVEVSPDGRILYAPIYGSAGVGHAGTDGSEMLVIDVTSRKVVRIVDFGRGIRPHKPVYDAKRKVLYVTAELDKAVLAIDPVSYKTLYTISTGEPESHMLVLSHGGRFGYTANVSTGSVSVLDLDSHTTAAVIPVAKQIQRITIAPDDKTVYVSDAAMPRLAAIDTASRTVRAWMDLPGKGYGGVITLDGRWLALAMPSAHQVAVIDLAAMQIVKTVDVTGNPQEILMSPDGRTMWVSCSTSKQVAAIETETWTVSATLPAGMWVDGLAWTPLH